MHPYAIFFLRGSKIPKGSFREGAVAQATEGERVQIDLYVSSVEHLYLLCRNSFHRKRSPSLRREANVRLVSRTPHPSRPSHKGSVDPPSPWEKALEGCRRAFVCLRNDKNTTKSVGVAFPFHFSLFTLHSSLFSSAAHPSIAQKRDLREPSLVREGGDHGAKRS